MYKPGRIEVERPATEHNPPFHLALSYDVTPHSREQRVHFRLAGQIGEKAVDETFELHHDVAYNFLSEVSQRLRHYGLNPYPAAVFSGHEEYDRFFNDLRDSLKIKAGDPVDLEQFLKRENER